MTQILRTILLALSCAVASFAPASAQAVTPPAAEELVMLRLRDGGVHFGAIVDHSAEVLDFRLLTSGGLVSVPWAMLDPQQSTELQTRYGYVDTVAEEILIDAERLVLTSGATIEGVVLSREGKSFLIKTEGNLQQIDKTRVASIEQGLRIPALDVYSAEELYAQYSALAPATDAKAQWELAETCERIYAFGRAVEHYQRVRELDPTYRATELSNLLPRVKQKAEQQAQLDYLREADRKRKRGQWDAALDLLRGFERLYPDSALREDAKKQEARLLLARDEAAKEYVGRRWFYWMRRLTRDLAAEDTLAAARAYVDERLSEEIQKAVLADLQRTISKEAQLEQVKPLFAARRKVRYEATTYGSGTWLIGREAAQRGNEAEAAPTAAPTNETDAQRDALAARIRQFLKNQQVAARSRRAEEEDDEQQTFWQSFSASHRAMWLLAYYVENSGDLELRARPTLTNCGTCGGAGALEVLLTGGGGAPDQGNRGGGRGGRGGGAQANQGMQLQTCPACHGVQVVRRVHFR